MLVQIDYELRFDAPFHLGTGVTAGQIDRTVIRNASGHLYVPASTFKGVLREHCEQLCHFYLPNAQPPASPHNAYAALTQFGKAPPLIARIFGSPLYPGSLRFDDAVLVFDERERRMYAEKEMYEAWKDMQTSVATQVRIDRVTRTAANEALYTSEFGMSDLLFLGTIKGSLNCTPVEMLRAIQSDVPTPTYSLLVLLAGLLMIERLGGNKSTGKGQCRCSITLLQLDKQLCTEEWRSWIEQLDDALNTYPDEGGQA